MRRLRLGLGAHRPPGKCKRYKKPFHLFLYFWGKKNRFSSFSDAKIVIILRHGKEKGRESATFYGE
jgi:hypothetical protein